MLQNCLIFHYFTNNLTIYVIHILININTKSLIIQTKSSKNIYHGSSKS